MQLLEYLQRGAGLSTEKAHIVDQVFDYIELPKGYQLLSEGKQSKKIFYVEKGMMRLYYLKDGKDITHDFFDETKFYAPIENIFLNQPYPYYLEMLENGIIRTADFMKVEKIMDTDTALQRFSRHVLVSTIKRLAEQLYSIQFQSAQERYQLLIKRHPNILLRSSLGHIASYLGITQSTLSVIRGEKSK
ncbi:Crp/Fnr family transcriptional regulator [Chryseobacterium tongliaoense]|uniref:Crp/Fnr family transcriptional regulator n=1 Tax=Chryseobacterium tongliaoense TaxID=3240933 RepID=UPI0035120AC2